MILAVTGITGHSGSFMLQQLIDNKFDGTLRCLVRETSNRTKLESSGLNVEYVVGSSKNPEDWLRLVDGADTVMHISGIWETPLLLQAVEKSGGKPHIVLVHTSGIFSKHKMASEVYKNIEDGMQKYFDMGMNITILRPTMISVGILETMWVWNDYLLPTLVLDIKQYRTIPMLIQYFRGGYGKVEMGPMMACIMLTVLPVIIIYLICQKHIIKGVVAGAVKG